MVKRWHRNMVRLLVYSAVAWAAWTLIPEWTVNYSDPEIRLVRNALASCRLKNNAYPESFLAVEPFLELSTRTDCHIMQSGAEEYRVEMPLVEGKRYYIAVTYAVGPDGTLEKYDVRIVGSDRGG